MTNTFIIADPHYGHSNIIIFMREDGVTPLRHFSSIEEHDTTQIDNHNRVVGPKDKVYFLGDIAFSNAVLQRIMPQLNGEKVLIKGNHDVLKVSQYVPYFKDIRACHTLDKLILSHIPVHPSSLTRWKGNIHGHLHNNLVHTNGTLDTRYINVCVECTNYTPVSFEDIKQTAIERGLYE